LINLFTLAIKLLFIVIIIYFVYLLIIKKTYKAVVILIVSFLILLIMLNPNRARFNNAVFEGGSNPITENQEIMGNIRNINGKDYGNANHPLVKRRNYLLFSIYDVHVSDTKVYHILGFLDLVKLIN
jgi:ABC-type bacteriocin/lantibiotic exporter with double-glycine peptidase domain